MSMSAAALRLASASAAAMISLRLRSLRSLHFLAAMAPSAYLQGPRRPALYTGQARPLDPQDVAEATPTSIRPERRSGQQAGHAGTQGLAGWVRGVTGRLGHAH